MKSLILKSSFLFILSLNAYPFEFPDGGLKLEFNMDFEPTRHVICEKKFDGINKKHGPYKTYNSDGSIYKEEYYQKGKLIDKASAAPRKETKIKIPNIGLLLRSLVPSNRKANEAGFNTRNCDSNEMSWASYN